MCSSAVGLRNSSSKLLLLGWPGLREKIVCQAAGLDDVVLECTKILMMRGGADAPIADDTDLRLREMA